ncbi:hypothetical protein [Halomarina litorea]|uniref:hypothetical protein n=1 Tax=Halomarina litorea TaxID=2961595 RepID=UPI0034A2E8C2
MVWVNVGAVGHSVTADEDRIPEDAAYFDSAEAGSEAATRRSYPQQGDIAGGVLQPHLRDRGDPPLLLYPPRDGRDARQRPRR